MSKKELKEHFANVIFPGNDDDGNYVEHIDMAYDEFLKLINQTIDRIWDSGKEVFFICQKCGHHLFIDEGPKMIKTMEKEECPECGEEPDENWALGGYGKFKNFG